MHIYVVLNLFIILYIKTKFAKVCSGLGIFQVANTPQILTALVP